MLTVDMESIGSGFMRLEVRYHALPRPATETATLRRLAELNDIKPQHDLDERRTLGRATLWGWCECGTVHDLSHDCPVCYAQQPETD